MQRCKYLSEVLKKQKQKEEEDRLMADNDITNDTESLNKEETS